MSNSINQKNSFGWVYLNTSAKTMDAFVKWKENLERYGESMPYDYNDFVNDNQTKLLTMVNFRYVWTFLIAIKLSDGIHGFIFAEVSNFNIELSVDVMAKLIVKNTCKPPVFIGTRKQKVAQKKAYKKDVAKALQSVKSEINKARKGFLRNKHIDTL